MKVDLKKSFLILLYFLPFILFSLGYLIPFLIFNKKTTAVPNIVGKSVSEGLLILADKKLDLRLLRTQEEANVAEGTIIYQTPQEKSIIRPNQHIFIVVSKKPKSQAMPNFSSYSKDMIVEWCNKFGKIPSFYWINYNKPKGSIISQYPTEGEIFEEQNLIIYLSEGPSKISIMPNFKGLPFNEVKNFLDKNDASYDIFYKNQGNGNSNKDFIIEDQHPKAGSIVNLSKKLYVQIYASFAAI